MRLQVNVPGGVKFWCYLSNPSLNIEGTAQNGCIDQDKEESYGVEWNEDEVNIFTGVETTTNFSFPRSTIVTSIEDFMQQWVIAAMQYELFFNREEGLVDQPYSDNE
jgi:hypothetical protein